MTDAAMFGGCASMPDRIEIRPPKRTIVAKLLALDAILIPASLYIALKHDDLFNRIIGILGLFVFGVVGVFTIYRVLVRTWSFAISDDGIEIPENGLPWIGTRGRRVAWSDVEAVGIANLSGQKMVGLRLSSYEAYLTRSDGSSGRNQARRRLLPINRALCRYDLCFPWSQLDRSPHEMVDLLSRYRRTSIPESST